MANEMKRVPELRFSQFDKEWEKTTIADIGEFYYGRSAPKWSITDDATIPCVRYGELYTKHKGTVKEIYSYTNIERNKLRFSKGGEILIPRVGEDPMDFAKCSYLPFSGVAIGEMISVYNTDQNPVFITAYFNSQMKYEFAKRVEGASVSNLYYSYLKDINLRIPTIEEQQKIGDFFSKLDRQIELEEQKLAKLEEQKKGYMQKLFSQELRFKDENGYDYPEWMETNIRNTFDNKGGTALEKEFDNNGTHKVISIGSYSMNSTYNEQNLRINKNEFTENYLLNEGDLAMVLNDKTKEGNIIGRSIYIDEDDKYIYNQRTERLIPLTGNNHKFLWYLMNSEQFRKKIKQMMQGATQVYINYNSIKDLRIYLPILEEQNKIENFLGDIFNIIKNQSDKVELLKRRKKGFLQKMFV
ncbi:restriction endonuclease subunit S [Staphylococcus cohnii]|uniref:restriction endonuclease subunit S n=1 Tax=Staphylococcus TaxID=1279 RepID=UPI001AEBFED1|nr:MULTISPECIES: restriction endonuclease subunit S [unclassified Staphylococcus]